MEALIYEITNITVILDILQFTDTKCFILLEILNLVHHLAEHLWGVLWRIAILDEANLDFLLQVFPYNRIIQPICV